MNDQILQTTIEFVKKATPENVVSAGAQTSDFIFWPWLIVLGIVAISFAGILLFNKFHNVNIKVGKHGVINEVSLSKKYLTLFVAITFATVSIFAIAFTYSRAFANSQVIYNDKIQVVVDEENNTMEIPNPNIINQTQTRIYFTESNAEVLEEAKSIIGLDKTIINVDTQNGLLFNGPADSSVFKLIECNPFDDSMQLNLDVSFENLKIEQAKKLVDKGPVFRLNFTYNQKCIVVFDNQGTGEAPASQEQNIGGTVQEPTEPSDVTYKFSGWFKESTCKNKWDFTIDKVEKNTVLYASWTLDLVKFENQFKTRVLEKPEYKPYIEQGLISLEVYSLDGTSSYLYNGSNSSYAYNADKKIHSASMIKLLILAEFMGRVDIGDVTLSEIHVINETDKGTGGAGHINAFPLGTEVPLDDIAKFMIMYSDNAAANVLIDRLGKDNINNKAKELQLKNTELGRKLIVETPPPDNWTSAEDCSIILHKIYDNTLASKQMCDRAQEYLLAQIDDAAMGSVFKSKGIPFGHKTGSLAGATPARHDGGIVYAKRPFVICATMEMVDAQSNPIMQDIANIAVETLCG